MVGHMLYSNVVEGWTLNYKCQDPKRFVSRLKRLTMENFQFAQMLFALKESYYKPLDDYIHIIESWISQLDMLKQYIRHWLQILEKKKYSIVDEIWFWSSKLTYAQHDLKGK